jgi:two-component system sensor histidine kinase HydH
MQSLSPTAPASHRFQSGMRALREQADARIFWVLLAQWTVTLFASIAVANQADHPRLDLLSIAVLAIGALSLMQLGMILRWPGRTQTRWTIVASEAVISSLLWYVSGGRPESHFHLFAWLVVLSLYRDVPVLLTTVLASLSVHLFMISSGMVPPLPVDDPSQLTTYLIWMAWMISETAFLLAFVVLDRQALASKCDKDEAVESLEAMLQSKYDEATVELIEATMTLQREVATQTDRRKVAETAQQQLSRELLSLRRDVATHGTAILKFASRPADSSLTKAWQSHWQGLRQQAQHLMHLIDLPSLAPETQGRANQPNPIGEQKPLEDVAVVEKRAMLLMRNPLQQAKAVTALEREGYRVDVVPNGPRTYYSVMLNDYSVVVVDIDLPEDEGFDTLEALQLLPPDRLGKSKTLIAVTSDMTPERVLRSTELGVSNLLLKPLQADALRQTLDPEPMHHRARTDHSRNRNGAAAAFARST